MDQCEAGSYSQAGPGAGLRATEQKVQGGLRAEGTKQNRRVRLNGPQHLMYVIPLIGNVRTDKSLEKESRLVGARGCGRDYQWI